MNLRDFELASERRKALEEQTGTGLSNIGNFTFDEENANNKNIENLIGASQIPLGIAGPLKINGSDFSEDLFIPLATTEGALVASVSRGAKAITLSGGANSYSYKVGQTRGPVFEVKNLEEQRKVYKWIQENDKKMAEVSDSTSSHLKFKKAKVKSVGNYIFVRFYFETGDAMGMNMVTIAAEKVCKLIEEETGAKCITVAGNFDIDKKPSWLNFINNRGHKVWSEVILKREVLEDVLKTTAGEFYDVWLAKCMIGSAMSGSLGFNAHFANVIAAIFAATGQDLGHVVEGSMGITTAKVLEDDLLVSVYLPALQVGTVGGGTGLATQKEALSIMRVAGSGKVQKFAEIVGAAVLAGEISLLSSLAEGTLAKAHKELGRGEK
jgi:hydroxymethylglutaryl-CoA reductase (NADPH)